MLEVPKELPPLELLAVLLSLSEPELLEVPELLEPDEPAAVAFRTSEGSAALGLLRPEPRAGGDGSLCLGLQAHAILSLQSTELLLLQQVASPTSHRDKYGRCKQ